MKVGDLMPLISAFTFNISSILNVGRTIIDLILVWYVIYLLISMMKQNMRTMQLFKGVLLILILKMFTSLLRLSAMDYLVDTKFLLGVWLQLIARRFNTRVDYIKNMNSLDDKMMIDRYHQNGYP